MDITIAEALCSGLWYDFDADLRASKKIPLEATFSACGWSSGLVGPHRTRIDHFLLNHFSIAAAKDVQIFRGPLAPGHCPINWELGVEVFCTECMMLKPVESWNLPLVHETNKRGRREMRNAFLFFKHFFRPCWNRLNIWMFAIFGTRFVTWFMTCWMRSHSRKLERKEAKCHLSKKPSCYLRLRRFPARRNGFRKSAGPYMNLS